MRENQIKGVMTELVESKDRKSAFEVFLSTEDIPQQVINEKSYTGAIRSTINKVLADSKQKYAQILRTKENEELFKIMADLETTIIQSRCALATEIKLTLVNQKRGGSETSYVVVRAPFYNPDNVKAEIRVYLGKAEELGNDLNSLSKDAKFMDNAERLIVKAMAEVMDKRGVLPSIKKSAGVTRVVTAGVDEENSYSEKSSSKERMKLKKPKRENPFELKHNPRPKSGNMIVGLKGENKKDK